MCADREMCGSELCIPRRTPNIVIWVSPHCCVLLDSHVVANCASHMLGFYGQCGQKSRDWTCLELLRTCSLQQVYINFSSPTPQPIPPTLPSCSTPLQLAPRLHYSQVVCSWSVISRASSTTNSCRPHYAAAFAFLGAALPSSLYLISQLNLTSTPYLYTWLQTPTSLPTAPCAHSF
jgi:hypothetical protein